MWVIIQHVTLKCTKNDLRFKYNNHHRDNDLFRAVQLYTIKYLFNKIFQK